MGFTHGKGVKGIKNFKYFAYKYYFFGHLSGGNFCHPWLNYTELDYMDDGLCN